jgi:hypothetical protein
MRQQKPCQARWQVRAPRMHQRVPRPAWALRASSSQARPPGIRAAAVAAGLGMLPATAALPRGAAPALVTGAGGLLPATAALPALAAGARGMLPAAAPFPAPPPPPQSHHYDGRPDFALAAALVSSLSRLQRAKPACVRPPSLGYASEMQPMPWPTRAPKRSISSASLPRPTLGPRPRVRPVPTCLTLRSSGTIRRIRSWRSSNTRPGCPEHPSPCSGRPRT